jgi:transcriptional regulator with XRE-family HTH domain
MQKGAFNKMKEELRKEIGSRMRRIRKSLGYTQEKIVEFFDIGRANYEKIVEFFDIGRANYSRIEKGEVWPGHCILYTLRMKFNISLDWVIANTGKMYIREGERKVHDKADSNTYSKEIRELLYYIEKVPMIKHAILSYFLEYKGKNKEILDQILNKDEASPHQFQNSENDLK